MRISKRNPEISLVLKKAFLYFILIGMAIVIIIQFFPSPRNSGVPGSEDFIRQYNPPDQVSQILQNSCYDCHSNTTRYPWYTHLQPVGWFMANHIREGKEELNFSAYGKMSALKKRNKLKGIINSIRDETMPLSSYLLMHPDAKLTENEKRVLVSWLSQLQDSLASH